MTFRPADIKNDDAVAAIKRRQAQVRGDKPKVKRDQPEAREQKSVVQFLDLALRPEEVFWSATLNGVRVGDPTIRARLREQGLRPGVLDLVFIPLVGPEVGHSHWIEMKSADGVTTKEQRIVLAALEQRGLGAVCRSPVEVQAQLMAWGFPLHARI